MRTWRRKKWGIRTAAVVAALYALCVMAPPVALAFTDGAVAAHCLTGDHFDASSVGAGPAHHHEHGSPQHDDEHDSKGHAGSCCGLFCLVALPITTIIHFEQPVHALIASAVVDHLAGREVSLLFRPPKTVAVI